MRNALKIRLEGEQTAELRSELKKIPVIEIVSSQPMAWLSGSAGADVVFVDFPVWLAASESERQAFRQQEQQVVVILVCSAEQEEDALAQLAIDADDYILPTVTAEQLARVIRNARQRRSLLIMLRDTQAKLAQTHLRLTQLLDDGAPYRIGAELARETELIRSRVFGRDERRVPAEGATKS